MKPARLSAERLEDRATPSAAAAQVNTFTSPATSTDLAYGSDAGEPGRVAVFHADGSQALEDFPYGAGFTGGVRVALADVTGDGTPDLITAAGPTGPPLVYVFDGGTGHLARVVSAYEDGFTGGVNVAASDLTGDGKAEVVVGADQGGGPRVRVFDGATVADPNALPATLADFSALDDPDFRGGIRLALGDVSGDGVADLLVGAGFGGGPRVAGFDGAALGRGQPAKLFNDFYAFEGGLRNGIYVGVGDVTGDGKGDLLFGGGPGGSPRVRAADGAKILADGGAAPDLAGSQVANFFAGDASSREGVRVGSVPAGDGTALIVAADVAGHSAAAYRADGTLVKPLPVPAGTTGVFFADGAYTRTAYAGSGGSAGGGGATGGSSGGGSAGGSGETFDDFVSALNDKIYADVTQFARDVVDIEQDSPTLLSDQVVSGTAQVVVDLKAGNTLSVFDDFEALGQVLIREAVLTEGYSLSDDYALLADDGIADDLRAVADDKAVVIALIQYVVAGLPAATVPPVYDSGLFDTGADDDLGSVVPYFTQSWLTSYPSSASLASTNHRLDQLSSAMSAYSKQDSLGSYGYFGTVAD